jgi:subtilisin family serine protease
MQYVKRVHLDKTMYALEGPGGLPPLPVLGDPTKLLDEMMKGPLMVDANHGWIGTFEVNKATGIYELHSRGFKGQGVKVWVLDTGVDQTHPQLQGVIAGAYSTTLGTPHDSNGHGSWCCSRIVGQLYTHPILGLTCLGGAPECELYSVKVLTDLGFGNTSDILKGMQMALDAGADIISMSLGGDGDAGENGQGGEEEDPMTIFINKAAETNPHTIFCIAAGNSGSDGEKAGSTVGIPGNATEAVTVGAASLVDGGARAYYSSTGPTLQAKRVKPDIMGIGGGAAKSGGKKGVGDLFSGSAFGSQLDPTDYLIDGWAVLKGTSMATPEIAAICALFHQATNKLLTARDLKAIFAKYGLPKTNEYGYGLINATWVLQALGQ